MWRQARPAGRPAQSARLYHPGFEVPTGIDTAELSCLVTIGTYPALSPDGGSTIRFGSIDTKLPLLGGFMYLPVMVLVQFLCSNSMRDCNCLFWSSVNFRFCSAGWSTNLYQA